MHNSSCDTEGNLQLNFLQGTQLHYSASASATAPTEGTEAQQQGHLAMPASAVLQLGCDSGCALLQQQLYQVSCGRDERR